MSKNKELMTDTARYELYCLDPEKYAYYSPVYMPPKSLLQRVRDQLKQQLERKTT